MVDHLPPSPPAEPSTPEALRPGDPGGPPAPEAPAGRAALAGMVGAAVALATGEIISSLSGAGQSLVASVGTAFIDRFAASLKDLAVSLFGTNDKAALVVGIIVISIGLGAVLGVASRRRPLVGAVGFAAFGLVGAAATLADPQANDTLGLLAAAGAVAAGVVTLRVLLRVAATGGARAGAPGAAGSTVTEHPTDPAASRRAFMGWAGALGGGAVVAVGAARALAGRSAAEQARSTVTLPRVGGTAVPAQPGALDVNGLSPYYVPNKDFYLIDTALRKPQIDPASWRLRITGDVDRPYELSFDDLLAMPQIEEAVTLSCVSNEVGGDLVGNALWQGVRLADVLDRAGVRPGGTQIVGISTDGFTAGFPTAVGLDGRVAMIAVGMNGEPLPIAHGFPARLVVSGLYGYVSATKWLQEIRLTGLDFDGYWIDKGWSKEAPVKTQSRIDVPAAYRSFPAGPTKVAGVAWAPDTGIAKVEVQIDQGPWTEASLASVVSKDTWVQWVMDWDAPEGEHELRVRATDSGGTTQTSDLARPDPDGATGWHRIRVTVTGG